MKQLKTILNKISNVTVNIGKGIIIIMPYASMALETYLNGFRFPSMILFGFIIFLGIISSTEVESKVERMLFISYMYYALLLFLLIIVGILKSIGV